MFSYLEHILESQNHADVDLVREFNPEKSVSYVGEALTLSKRGR